MEQIEKLVQDLGKTLEKSGLYLESIEFGTSNMEIFEGEDGDTISPSEIDIRQKMIDGEAQFVVTASFSIGEIAFSDRVLNPEKYDEDKRFKAIVPTEEEMTFDKLKKKMSDGDFNGIADDDFDPDSVEW